MGWRLGSSIQKNDVNETNWVYGSSVFYEVVMTDIFVEQKDDGTYKATQNKRVIAKGDTQAEAIAKAHQVKPNDPILAERVRNTKVGSPDKWRRAK